MPFSSRNDLPKKVKDALRDVPHAQDMYKEAFNSAYDQYASAESREDDRTREETAHAVAWSAVKRVYEKGDDDKWHPKPE